MQMLTYLCLNTEIKAENPEWLSLNERKNDGERTNASVTWCTNEWKIDRVKIVNFKKEVQHFMLSRLVTWVIELMGTSMRSISSSQSWTGRQWTGNSIMRSSSFSCWVVLYASFWYSRNRFRSNKIKLRIWFYVFSVENLFVSGVR